MNHNVSVAIFWHFHQPIYSNPEDCTLPLPWVRLHCIKDYLDMLKHVQNYPDAHVTFNFTPSLLRQIDDYRTGKCSDVQFHLFQKKAAELTIDDKKSILRDFFLAHWEQMIETNRRYFSLLLKRGKIIVEEELETIAGTFTEDEMRDLQIWSNLVWIDPLFRDEIIDLYEKGKNFSEKDKERVIAVEQKIIGSIIDEYKKAQESGQIEISTSPLYHPILPLLIDSDLAKVANPNVPIPFQFKHPEDAKHHISEGLKLHENFFGRKAQGLWPSEGSVCEELIPLLAEHGIRWIATDEEILARSIDISFRRDEHGVPNRPDLLYKPWNYHSISMLFRDHTLSDRIGFVYNQWDQVDAAQDFVQKLIHIRNALPTFENFVIPIILDGENAWESYVNDGTEFLKNMYHGLLQNGFKMTTISEFLQHHKVENNLPTIFPGSWIGANFNIWIGHPEDHVAWQILTNLRQKLVQRNITDQKIWDRFYILEGSDWYWWFGGEHYSAVSETFDELFRRNVIWIYTQINEEPPPELFSSIKKPAERLTVQPNDKMTPEIDGLITHFYEWFHAGHAAIDRMGGTMHRFAGLFSTIYCGFDKENLYVRFDIEDHDISDYEYKLKFYKPKEVAVDLTKNSTIVYKLKDIAEVSIPLQILGIDQETNEVEFLVTALQKGVEIDRTPLLSFMVKLHDVKLFNWTV